jgi:hypothetical protein
MDYGMHTRRHVSEAGRQQLARAVQIDHDWDLPASSEDKLIAALGDLTDADLEGAYLLACRMKDALTCVQIRRDMDADKAAKSARIAKNAPARPA